jgi:2-hydroxy-6-oxonona-2,4-dienedioate hydrolase
MGTASTPDPPTEEHEWRVDAGSHDLFARSWSVPGASPAGPSVVLLHGLGIASRMCRPLGEHLAGSYPVMAPDLPGFGKSSSPDRVLDISELADAAAAWIERAGVGDPVVVGTSLGSQVAIELAHRHPERCRAVVLASPIVDESRRSWPNQIARWQLEQATQSMSMRALMVRDYAQCGVARVARTFAHALAYRPEEVVPELGQPVLVCWGTRDPLCSREWVERVAELAPDGDLAVLPGVVHAMCHENPLEMARVISRFVDRLPVERGSP